MSYCHAVIGPAHRALSTRQHFRSAQRCSNPARGLGAVTVYASYRSTSSIDQERLKRQIVDAVDNLGPSAILPGSAQDKSRVDALLQQLEQCDSSAHLRSDSTRSASTSSASSSGVVDSQLFGDWELVYASNGTVVTRTGIAQLLIGAAAGGVLPGVGINDITQKLGADQEGVIQTSNEAKFGFGPLGTWEIGIDGVWRNAGDGRSVKVLFDKVRIKMVGLLGLQLPDWLPQVSFAVGDSTAARGGADWYTTYLDSDMRIGKGKSGNIFLFRRRAQLPSQ